MFVQFIIASAIIFVSGPLHNEGGSTAIQEKGFKEAVITVIDERKPLDYSKLND